MKTLQLNGIKTFYAKTRNAWRKWLERNHQKEGAVWLVIHHRKSKTPSVYLEDAVEEALCFGWIDSKSIPRDAESRYQYFCPRKPKSGWSKINRGRAERLIGEGLMTPAGQYMIDLAKQTGTWEAMVDVENGVIPDDLMKRFAKNKKALKNFQAFSPSSRRIILAWILNAKRPETRRRRIEETVIQAAKNLKAYG